MLRQLNGWRSLEPAFDLDQQIRHARFPCFVARRLHLYYRRLPMPFSKAVSSEIGHFWMFPSLELPRFTPFGSCFTKFALDITIFDDAALEQHFPSQRVADVGLISEAVDSVSQNGCGHKA